MKLNLFRKKEVLVSNITQQTYTSPLLHQEYTKDAGQALKDFASNGVDRQYRGYGISSFAEYLYLTNHPEEVYKILRQYYGD